MRLTLVAVMLSAHLAGCAAVSTVERLGQVEIAEAVVLSLPTASGLTDFLEATQLITGTFDGRSYTMQVEMEWRPGSIALAALNVWGTVVFTIAYDGEKLRVEGNPLLLRGIRPEFVLADILITFSEQDAVAANLHGDGIVAVDVGPRRTISRHGEPIIVIDYGGDSRWEGQVTFRHIERGYVMEIQTIAYASS